jgi:zinc protease
VPGALQTEIRVGKLGPAFGNSDTLPLQIAADIVGGASDSRLRAQLHDVLKPGDEVRADVNPLIDAGAFVAQARVRNEIAGDVLGRILAEMERLSAEPVTATELEPAKSALIGTFLLRLESQQALADTIALMKLAGLQRDYVEGFTSRVSAIDAARVQAAAKKWLTPDTAAVVVIGDAAKLKDQLVKIGTFEIIGRPTSPPSAQQPPPVKP